MGRESQASLEFLTTYTWAFLVIAITIGALYSFGALDFSKFSPPKCVFPSQFKCLDFSLQPTNIKVKLINDVGEDICVRTITLTQDAASPVVCTLQALPRGPCRLNEINWPATDILDINFASCNGRAYLPNEKAELNLNLVYYSPLTTGNPNHSIKGKINGRVTSS